MKKILILLMLSVIASGCHTIRPSIMAEASFTKQITQKNRDVMLVMDKDYRSYVSKDRGHALADPQKYMIGSSLSSLTYEFFKEGFNSVESTDSMPSAATNGSGKYIVKTSINNFDNDVTMGHQTIYVELMADIFDEDLNKIASVKSMGQSDDKMSVLGSSKKSGFIVSKAMQTALVSLIHNIQEAM